MHNKLRLAMGATALLYLGPLLAGLAGYGWALIPAFVLIFTLWLIVMRPALWPRDPAAWRRSEVVVAAAAQVAVQALLVVICFGVGRGIGGVAGVVPMLSPILPLALSFLAVPLTRLLWSPGQAAKFEALLEEATGRIEGASGGASHLPPVVAERVDALLNPLLALPEDTPDAEVTVAVAAAMEGAGDFPVDVLPRLIDRLDQIEPPHGAVKRGLILWATDPTVAGTGRHSGALRAAWATTWPDAGLLHLFATRALALVAAQPDLWRQMPDLGELNLSLEEANPEAVNATIRLLIARIEAAMPPDLRPAAEDAAGAVPTV